MGGEQTEYIDLKYTSGGSPVLIKSSIVCSGGSYGWDTSSVGDGNNYQIVLYYTNDYSINDNSDNPFTIDNTDPTITSGTLISPNGGEFWAGESTQTIAWNTSDITDTNLGANPITLEYYNGSSWEQIATGEENDGSYEWNPVPSLDISTAKVRITATDLANNTASDESDAVFVIDSINPVFASIDVTDDDTFYKAGDTISFTVNLGEADLIVTANLKVLDTALSETFPLTHSSDGIYTGTTGVLSGETMQEGLKAVTITATDRAGNYTTDSSLGLTIDKTDPTVTITSSETGTATNADPIPITITFNEEVVGFDVTDIAVGNGTAGNFISTANPVFTVDINPTVDGAVTVDVFADKVADLAGNLNTASNNFSIIYDGTAPTFTVNDDVSEVWVGSDDVKFTINYATSGAGDTKYVLTDGTCAVDDFTGNGIDYTSGDTLTFDNETDSGKYLCLEAGDKAGNFGYKSVGPFMIDTAVASIIINDNASTTYVKSDDIKFTVDYTTSGAGDTEYVLTGGTCIADDFTGGGTDYTSGATLTFDNETNHDGKYVCLRARDGKGDEAPVEEYTYLATGQLKIDRTNPTVTIDTVETPTSDDTQLITGIYDEAHISEITVNEVVATFGAGTYSATVSLTEGDNPINVIATDVAGNIGTNAGPVTINLDTQIPTIENLFPADGSIINDNTPTISATLDDDNSGINKSTIVVTVDSNTVSHTFSGGVVSYTPTIVLGDSQHTVTIDVDDKAGNPAATKSSTFTVDTTKPTGTVSVGTATLYDGDKIQEVTVTYNEPMDPESTPTITFGATAGTITSNSDGTWDTSTNQIWTELFTITDANEEKTGVTVSSSGAKDVAGNTEDTNATSPTFNIDTKNPTLNPVVIVSSNTNNPTGTLAKVGDIITLTFTADENIQTTPAVTIAENSTNIAVTNINDNIWTATYTMTNNDNEGVVPFTIDFTDIAGDIGDTVTGTTDGLSVTFDRTAPTVEITSTETSPTKASPFQVTITFSESVSDFEVGDITVGNGTASIDSTNNPIFTVNITPTGEAVTVDIAAGVATDLAGNGNTVATQFSITYDGTAPTVGIVLTNIALIAGETTTVTFTFSEDPTGFAEEDVTVIENGTLSNFTVVTGDTKIYTATFTPTVDTEDTENIITVGTDWTDAAGNAPVGTTNSANYTVETLRPIVVISSVEPNPTNSPFSVTIDFSEAVVDFTINDITVSNGTASNPVQSSGDVTIWTVDITPTIDGEVTVKILANKATDLAGNGNIASNVFSITYDKTPPTVPTVSDPAGAIIINEDAYAISGIAEANSLVQVYENTDVVGSQQLTGNAIDYSISVTLAQNTTNNFTVTATDAAENESVPAIVPTITEDSLDPSAPDASKMTIEMNPPETADTISGTGAVEGGAVVKVYSNVILGETNKIGEETAAADGSFGPIEIGDNLYAIVYVTATDAAGNRSGGTPMDNDIEAPTVPTDLALTDPVNNGNQTTVAITGKGEANADIDWTISDSGSETVTDSGTDKVSDLGVISITDIDVSALADGTLTLTLTLADSAGNVSVAGTDTAEKDTAIPTVVNVTSAIADGVYKAGVSIDITVEFSEAVIVDTTSGTSQLELETGDTNRQAIYIGGSGTKTLTFTYIVQSGDTSSDLDYTSTSALTLNSGTIKDSAGNDATLALASPGATGSLGANKAIVIDTTSPSGYMVSIDQSHINNSNQTVLSFTFAGAEEGAVYNYSIDSSGGGETVIGGDAITATNQKIENIDVSGLVDGTLTLTVYLTDLAGNKGGDVTDTVVKDIEAPALVEIVPVTTPTNDSTPGYVFNTTEAGTITYGGICSSNTTEADAGDNTNTGGTGDNIIIFNELADGTYDDCTIIVTDDTGNVSNILAVSGFTIDTTAPVITNLIPGDSSTTSDTTPTISADFVENGSGVDIDSVVITVDGVDETSYSNITTGGIVYPSSSMSDGRHEVIVSLNDVAGNPVMQAWDFKVASTETTIIVTSAGWGVADGASQVKIMAQVLEGGNEVIGEDVNFVSTNNGTLDPVSAVTDSNGTATTYISSANAGEVIVTASYNSPNGVISGTISIYFAETEKAISVIANHNSVPADGVSISTITATVLDNNQSLQNALVSFTTDLGTLSDSSATTDSSGQATVTLISTDAGLANIEATYTGSGTIDDQTYVEFTEYDNTSPTATQYPADNSTNVATTVNPYIDFSEAMDESTLTYGNIELRECSGTLNDCTSGNVSTVSATLSKVTSGGITTVTIMPNDDLANDTHYYLFINSYVKDLADNSLSPTWTSSNRVDHEFTTVAEDEDVTSYSIPLNAGWNLISLPLIPNDSDIAVVLADISDNVEIVWYYEDGEWYFYDSANSASDLATMEDGKGYWIYMNTANNVLTVNGSETAVGGGSPTNYQLVEGDWNLIGFKSTIEMTAGDYIRDFTDHKLNGDSILWDYKDRNEDGKREYPTLPLHENDYMKPGYGYWLQGAVKK